MNAILHYIAQKLSTHFNQPIQITHHRQVFGGDINQTFHLETNGGSFFLKLNHSHLKDMFEKEFEGLKLLHQTKTIKIPEPFLYGNFNETVIPANAGISLNRKQIFLIIEYIQKGSP